MPRSIASLLPVIAALGAAPLAQAQPYSAANDLSSGISTPTEVVSMDVDGDGDQDLLIANIHGRRILWGENVDVGGPGTGEGTTWEAQPLVTGVGFPQGLHAVDLDGDGDEDFTYVADRDILRWAENLGGGVFTTHTIDSATDDCQYVTSADIDGDGDLDLVATASHDDSVYWYDNVDVTGPGTGDAATWARVTIDAYYDSPRQVQVADIDGDGDLDVVATASFADDVAWFENLDASGPGTGDGSSWSRTTIDADLNAAESVHVADFDLDGSLDVIAAGTFDDEVTWYANTAGDGSAWTATTLSTTVDGADGLQIADLDGDGDLDAAVLAPYDSEVVWLENDDVSGPGTGDGSSWTKSALSTAHPNTHALTIFDADVDGDLDVFAADVQLQEITKFLNDDLAGPGTGDGSSWTASAALVGFAIPWGVAEADIDGDGDTDLVFTAYFGASVWWLENDDLAGPGTGDGTSFTEHVVDPSFVSALGAWPGDIDGDGDLDLSATDTAGGDHVWFENVDLAGPGSGDGSSWVTHTVGNHPFAKDFRPVDLDGDGDLDLVGASNSQDTAYWYENVDIAGPGTGDGSSWSFVAVGTVDGPYDVHSADVDGDGDLDLLVAAQSDDEVVWFENVDVTVPGSGDGSAFVPHLIGTGDAPVQGYPADLDGDGDVDVAVAYNSGGEVVWYENVDVAGPGTGDGSLFAPGAVDSALPQALSLAASDLDGDGDLDLVATSFLGDTRWYENTAGDGSVWTPTVLGSGMPHPTGVATPDLDGDGDPDVVAALYLGGSITAFTNLNDPPLGDAGGPYTGDEPFTVALDASASTDDGVILTYEWDCDDDGTFEIASTGPTGDTCSFTDDGNYVVVLRLTDDNATSSTATAVVTVSNVAPTIGTVAATDATENSVWTYAPSATDPAGPADPLSWALHAAPAAMTVDASSGALAWTPGWDDVGSHTFTLTVDDDDGGSATETITVVVVYQDDDADGLPDTWEASVGLDPTVDDAGADADADGVSNLDEWLGGTDPTSFDGPTVPTATAPIDGTEVDVAAPTFEWTAATDPQNDPLTYDVEVYADDGMEELLASAADRTETTWTSDIDLPENAVAHWRVRAADPHVAGAWTDLQAFFVNALEEPPSVPTPASPLTDQTVDTLTPPLSWTVSTDPEGQAVSYEVEVWRGEELVLTGATDALEWTTGEPLLEDTTYRWTVRAGDERDTWSAWSAEETFRVDTTNNAPSDIAWVNPTDGVEVDTLSPALEVTESVDPEGHELTYVFALDTAESFDSEDLFTFERGVPRLDMEAAGVELTNGTWHLRARAEDPGGAASAWAVITIEVPYSAGCNCSVGAPTPGGGLASLLLLAVLGARRRR